jgi:hypothetical protein
LDAVKYNDVYYIARIDGGTISNIAPTNTTYWNTLGAEFETIATNLLLAEGANIGDWFIKAGQIVSTLDESAQRRKNHMDENLHVLRVCLKIFIIKI